MTAEPQETQPVQRRGRAAPVGGDSGLVGRAAFTRMGFADPTLVLRWSEIAGPEVARLAQPFRFQDGPQGGTLTLKALPGAALFLAHETRSLCNRINTFLGRPAVSKLKFVQGALPRPRAPLPPQRKAGLLPANDPARRFAGPGGLAQALQSLASRRAPETR